jgi:ComF family protein
MHRAVQKSPFQSPSIVSLFDFQETVIRQAIHAIKYYHRRDLIPPLARALAEEAKKIPAIGSYTLVPVPMPAMRKMLRGYNQAELIAEALGRELSLPVNCAVLKREHSPARQVKAGTRGERMRNQRGSFATGESPAGMRIILVDDVTTTGATVEEARRVLLSEKAADVLALTLAH